MDIVVQCRHHSSVRRTSVISGYRGKLSNVMELYRFNHYVHGKSIWEQIQIYIFFM